MNKKEALEMINNYNFNLPNPIIKYYQDSYRDGYQDASSYYVKYPPMSPSVIDAILEHDKDCKPYIADDGLDISENDKKFNDEMEKQFTDLINRVKISADSSTSNEDYCKKNQQLYSMSTKVDSEYITIIPMQLMTKAEFKEKALAASETLQLSNYHIYLHLNEDDKEGHEIFKSFPFHSSCISDADKNAFDNVIRFCDEFEKYAKNVDKDLLNKTLNETRHVIATLKLLAEVDYLNRIKEYSKQYEK